MGTPEEDFFKRLERGPAEGSEIEVSIQGGPYGVIEWGHDRKEWDNRGLDETWIHLYNFDETEVKTVVIGIAEAINIVENAFENSFPEDSYELFRVQEMCNDLRKYLKGERP